MLCFVSALILAGCQHAADQTTIGSQDNEKQNRYIFFLHNRFLEENDLQAAHPEYGKVNYNEIIQSFKDDGFIVISEKRNPSTDVKLYARKVVSQMDSLGKIGIKPSQITVIGTSKGGYIAQYVSTFFANPEANYVFIGCFQDSDIVNMPDINFCGNILTIYEKTDRLGVSAIKRKETSKLKVNQFKEIELDTKLKHGFLYRALPQWINPSKRWARQDFR